MEFPTHAFVTNTYSLEGFQNLVRNRGGKVLMLDEHHGVRFVVGTRVDHDYDDGPRGLIAPPPTSHLWIGIEDVQNHSDQSLSEVLTHLKSRLKAPTLTVEMTCSCGVQMSKVPRPHRQNCDRGLYNRLISAVSNGE